MKTVISRALMLIVCISNAVYAAAASNTPQAVAATAAQIERAQASKPFIEAALILAEQDEEVNRKTVRRIVVPGKPEAVVLHFDITRRGSTEPGEYKRLIYVDRGDKPPLVSFDEKTGRTAAMRLIGATICFPASPWSAASSICLGGTCFSGTCDRNNIETRTCGRGNMKRNEIRTSSVTSCGCTREECLHI